MLIFTCIAGILLLFFSIFIFRVGSKLCSPAHTEIGKGPSDLPIEAVDIPRRRGGVLRAWWIPGHSTAPVIVHFHGNRDNRQQIVQRARFLHAQGYNNLLPDFQAHGESDGDYVSYGYLESEDARDWIAYIDARHPQNKIGVIGLSLGGAACLIGEEPLNIHAIVLEMVYPTLIEAVNNRMRLHFGKIGTFFTLLLTIQLKFRLGFSVESLRPIDGVQKMRIPKFIMAGNRDVRTTLAQSTRFFESASEPKEFWVVEGAEHEDLHAFAKQAYEEKVLAFFQKWLGNEKKS